MAEQWESTLAEVEVYLEILAAELEAGTHLESHAAPSLPAIDTASLPPEALGRFEALRARSVELSQRYSRALLTARDAVTITPRPPEQPTAFARRFL